MSKRNAAQKFNRRVNRQKKHQRNLTDAEASLLLASSVIRQIAHYVSSQLTDVPADYLVKTWFNQVKEIYRSEQAYAATMLRKKSVIEPSFLSRLKGLKTPTTEILPETPKPFKEIVQKFIDELSQYLESSDPSDGVTSQLDDIYFELDSIVEFL